MLPNKEINKSQTNKTFENLVLHIEGIQVTSSYIYFSSLQPYILFLKCSTENGV